MAAGLILIMPYLGRAYRVVKQVCDSVPYELYVRAVMAQILKRSIQTNSPAYPVLLALGKQGLRHVVLFKSKSSMKRLPHFYDPTFERALREYVTRTPSPRGQLELLKQVIAQHPAMDQTRKEELSSLIEELLEQKPR